MKRLKIVFLAVILLAAFVLPASAGPLGKYDQAIKVANTKIAAAKIKESAAKARMRAAEAGMAKARSDTAIAAAAEKKLVIG